jgi:hypothetical protein
MTAGTAGATTAGTAGMEGGWGGAGGEPLVPASCPGLNGAEPDLGDYCYAPETGLDLVPQALFLLVDRSAAVSEPLPSGEMRLDALKRAFENLLELEPSWLVRVGIDLFPLSGGLDPGADCDASYYGFQQFGSITDVAPSVVSTLESLPLGGQRTLLPALEAALAALRESTTRAVEHIRLVIVTDGEPTSCNARAAATEIRALVEHTTDIDVRAIGYSSDVDLTDLVGSERAGWLNPEDPMTTFFPDLAPFCRFESPTTVDGRRVTSATAALYFWNGDVELLPALTAESDCASSPNGGYYPDPSAGGSVLALCPCSCARARLAERVQPLFTCE